MNGASAPGEATMATVVRTTRTPTEARPVAPPAETGGGGRRRFSAVEFERMVELGLFPETERVELLGGDLFTMSPTGYRHQSCVDRLAHYLWSLLGARAQIRVQGPVRLSDELEPLPDVQLLSPRTDFYGQAHPGPTNALLVIEVMDTSAAHDRGVKLGFYARSGVREVWLVDLNREWVETYRRPDGELYRENVVVKRGEGLTPEAFPEATLAVDDVLG